MYCSVSQGDDRHVERHLLIILFNVINNISMRIEDSPPPFKGPGRKGPDETGGVAFSMSGPQKRLSPRTYAPAWFHNGRPN